METNDSNQIKNENNNQNEKNDEIKEENINSNDIDNNDNLIIEKQSKMFDDEVTTLHVGAVESLSKFYNFLLKHKNENIWIPRLGEKFFVPYESKVRFDIWKHTDKQNQLQAKGLCFKTEKEAEKYRQRYLVKNKTIIK